MTHRSYLGLYLDIVSVYSESAISGWDSVSCSERAEERSQSRSLRLGSECSMAARAIGIRDGQRKESDVWGAVRSRETLSETIRRLGRTLRIWQVDVEEASLEANSIEIC